MESYRDEIGLTVYYPARNFWGLGMKIEDFAKECVLRVGRNGLAASDVAMKFDIPYALAWLFIEQVNL